MWGKPGLPKPGRLTHCQIPGARIPLPQQAHHRKAHLAKRQVPGSRARVIPAPPVTDVGGATYAICGARAGAEGKNTKQMIFTLGQSS